MAESSQDCPQLPRADTACIRQWSNEDKAEGKLELDGNSVLDRPEANREVTATMLGGGGEVPSGHQAHAGHHRDSSVLYFRCMFFTKHRLWH